eukprot:454187-Alexandrium_andersonii.AAC.1
MAPGSCGRGGGGEIPWTSRKCLARRTRARLAARPTLGLPRWTACPQASQRHHATLPSQQTGLRREERRGGGPSRAAAV